MSHGFVDRIDAVVIVTDTPGDDVGFGDFIGTIDTDKFLDQVDITFQVTAVGGNRNIPTDGAIGFAMGPYLQS